MNLPAKHRLKIWLISGIVGSLVMGAIVGIYGVMFGSIDDTSWRILATTLAIGITSLTGLANTRHLESFHARFRIFAWLSIGCSIVALCLLLTLIWLDFDYGPWEATGIFAVLAFSTAHISLLLPTRPLPTWLGTLIGCTVLCVAVVASLLIALIGVEDFADRVGSDGIFWRFLGVLAILDVLGTIVIPIMSRLAPPQTTAPVRQYNDQIS